MTVVAPDYAEPLEGWRVWRIGGDRGSRLLSLVHDTQWPPRDELVAECRKRRLLPRPRRRPPHRAPFESCRCGIYATTLDQLRPFLDERTWQGERCVFGEVRLWGVVVECERGWRASRAYPSRIFVPQAAPGDRVGASCDELAHELESYGVPVDVLPARGRRALALAATRGRRLGSPR